MSQTTARIPKLSIRQKRPNEPLTGFNAEVSLDGIPIQGLTFLKLELKPGRPARVLLELVAELEDFVGEVSDLTVNRF